MPARVIPYLALLKNEISLPEQLIAGTIVRIESPGENFEVEKRILALGGIEQALRLENEHGRIYYPGAWFTGFSRLMESVLQSAEKVTWFNHPADIISMFDKPNCKLKLAPYTLPSCPLFLSFDEFFSFVEQHPHPRFFIKLNYSSSASGVVAYEYNRKRSLEQAYSTVEIVESAQGNKYYNTLKIRKYTERKSIRQILDFLFQQGALVEPWIPKARHNQLSYDLRVIGIAQQRQHAIARLSRSPMTNLHLGNQRCSVEELQLPATVWQKIDALVEHTMRQFPKSLYAGLDVMLPRHGGNPILLEANAFGDLLPNLAYQGKSTYLSEIEALCSRERIAHA